MSTPHLIRPLLATVAALALGAPVGAAVQWTGAGDGSTWEDGANWAPAGPPGVGDFATVFAPATTVSVTSGAALELELDTLLDLTGGGSLAVGGTIRNQGDITAAAGATLSAGLVENGWNGAAATLDLSGSGTGLAVTEGLVNRHITRVSDAASLTAASFDNTHEFRLGSGASALAVSMINTSGAELSASGPGTTFALVGDPATTGAGALTNRGAVAVSGGATLTLRSIDNLGTVYAGTGGVIAVESIVNGTLAEPGAAFTVAGGVLTAGTGVLNRGALGVSSGGQAALGSIDNQGTLALSSGSTTGATSLVNRAAGLVQLDGAATTLTVTGNLANSGTLELRPGTTLSAASLAQDAGHTRLEGATLAAASLTIQGGSLFADTLAGGVIDGDLFLDPGATLHIGFEQGRLDITGDLALAGLALFDIAGTTPGSTYDRIRAGGSATLSGVLQIDLLSGFIPGAGDFFDILRADHVVDAGATLLYPALAALGFSHAVVDLAMGGQALRLATASAVIPLPPAGLLLIAGLLPVVLFARRWSPPVGSPATGPDTPQRPTGPAPWAGPHHQGQAAHHS